MPDALRLALGTLTVLRVPAPRVVDRRVARDAMLLAPLVGLLLGAVAAGVLTLVRLTPLGDRSPVAADLLGSALAVAALALLTRGLHLDGLADTADGLGAKTASTPATGGPTTAAGAGEAAAEAAARERRLAVMRAPDVGAFGAVTIVLVLLLQVIALAAASLSGRGSVGLVTAVVLGRLAITWCCVRGIRSARPDGLGAAVAGTVPAAAAAALTLAVLGLVVVLGLLDDDGGPSLVAALLASCAVGLAAASLILRRTTGRFGGITGDVLGAACELATTAALVVLALL